MTADLSLVAVRAEKAWQAYETARETVADQARGATS